MDSRILWNVIFIAALVAANLNAKIAYNFS